MADQEWLEWIDDDEEKRQKRHKAAILLWVLLSQIVIAYVIGQFWFTDSDESSEATKGAVSDSFFTEIDSFQTLDYIRASNRHFASGEASGRHTASGEASGLRTAYRRGSNHRTANGKTSNKRLKYQAQMVAELVRNLNSEVFRRVEALIETHRVEFFHIYIPSSAWGGVKEQERVDLLNKADHILRTHFPEETPSVVLKFDDDQQQTLSPPLALDYLIKKMNQSFTELNPEVYKSVNVELEGQESIEETGKVVLNELRIKKIDVQVRSESWDALSAQSKVDLINETMLFLKLQSPRVTPFVTLQFDDKRQELALKYVSAAVRG